MKLSELKRALRNGPHASPGGYPLFVVTSDGAALCFACVRKEWRQVCEAHIVPGYRRSGWFCEGIDTNWEDPALWCDHCSQRIESAYAEDEANTPSTGDADLPAYSQASHYS
jgi:hypothetical protein